MMGRSLAALRAHLRMTQVQMAEALRAAAPEFEQRFAAKIDEIRAQRQRESPYSGASVGAQTSDVARARRQRNKASAAKRARLFAIVDIHNAKGAPGKT